MFRAFEPSLHPYLLHAIVTLVTIVVTRIPARSIEMESQAGRIRIAVCDKNDRVKMMWKCVGDGVRLANYLTK